MALSDYNTGKILGKLEYSILLERNVYLAIKPITRHVENIGLLFAQTIHLTNVLASQHSLI